MLLRVNLIKLPIYILLVLVTCVCLASCENSKNDTTLTQEEIDAIIDDAIANSTVLTEEEIWPSRPVLTSEELDEIIDQLGTEQLYDGNWEILLHLTEPLVHETLINLLDSDDTYKRVIAVVFLFRLGDEPRARMEELLDYMVNGNQLERDTASLIFGYGEFHYNQNVNLEPYMDLVIEAYEPADIGIKLKLLEEFERYVTWPDVLQLLLDATNDKRRAIRSAAAKAFFHPWSGCEESLLNNVEINQALIDLLEDSDSDVRRQAVDGLSCYMIPEMVLPALRNAYDIKRNDSLKGRILTVLAEHNAFPDIENEILTILDEGNRDLVTSILEAIPEVGVFPGLIQRLCDILVEDCDPETWQGYPGRVCRILRKLGPGACDAVPTLLSLLKEVELSDLQEIVHTLIYLKDCSEEVVHAFGGFLEGDSIIYGLKGLGECGNDAAEYIPELLEIALEPVDSGFESQRIRRAAINALGSFTDHSDLIIPDLIELQTVTEGTADSLNINLALYRLGFEPDNQLRTILDVLYCDIPYRYGSIEQEILVRSMWAVGEIGPPLANIHPRLAILDMKFAGGDVIQENRWALWLIEEKMDRREVLFHY